MINSISDFAPDSVEAGTGLAIEYEEDTYLFFLAGTRHHCPPGEIFFAGIGGHREEGEDWISCARREAYEEIGADVEFLSAATTFHVSPLGSVQEVEIQDKPRPYALYEMIHPPHTPRAGEYYRLVIYQARLSSLPRSLKVDEVRGIIALKREQIRQSRDQKPRISDLLKDGALILAGKENIDLDSRVYPIGTAAALSYIFELNK